MKENRFNRREFIDKSAKTTLAVGLTFPWIRTKKILASTTHQDGVQAVKTPTLEFRTLGRTGLKVTTVAYGAMRTREPAVIHRAIDYGLNYIDTAHCYMDGYNEIVVGKVLKTRRKETFIATKVHNDSVDKMMASIEASLKSLQTDYVDVIQLHNLKEVSQIKDERAMEALQRMKKEGKARYIAFTTHRNQIELIKAAIPMNFYDVILVAYNFKSPKELGIVIQDAAKAGIGIVGMKTQAGGYQNHKMGNLSPHQASLKWVLQNPGVATTIPSMVTYGQLDENIQVMGSKMGWRDRKTLHKYDQSIDSVFCRMCDDCQGTCPKGVDVLDVNRCLMYAEGYRDTGLAHSQYQTIPFAKRPNACLTCQTCQVTCSYGLNVHAKMKQALKTFA